MELVRFAEEIEIGVARSSVDDLCSSFAFRHSYGCSGEGGVKFVHTPFESCDCNWHLRVEFADDRVSAVVFRGNDDGYPRDGAPVDRRAAP